MTEHNSDLLRTLAARGYIHQVTDAAALDALATTQAVPAYVGFDATASSLHVGNLVSVMLLRRLQQAGHKPIVVMGGGTTKVGDPSGKDEVRKLLDGDGIATNIASIRRIFERFLTFGDGPTDAVMIDNAEWLDKLEYIPFLRDVGRHFTINRMLTFDSVKLRLDREQPLTFLEFNYMILQAYDFLELSRRVGCRLQMGGSDQWGNIVNGIELTRRIDGTELFGLTTPLITRSDGQKMGKSVNGAIWLHEDQLPHFDYWQFWRNTDDRDVAKFMALFTDVPIDAIDAACAGDINAAKVLLATEATALCRGRQAAEEAAATAAAVFGGGGTEGLPRFPIGGADITLVDALVETGLTASKGEARRKIGEGAVRVDGAAITAVDHLLPADTGERQLSLGKKRHVVICA